jgi:glycosyltransferase involved in cell wall biosynthesis
MTGSSRILHVITTIQRGGAENHLAQLVTLQRRMGRTVKVAYLKGTPDWADHLHAQGVETVALGLNRYGDPRPLLRLRRLIRQWRPTILHAHMPPAELYARCALMADRKTPFVVSKHNDEPFFRGRFVRPVSAWSAARADRVIAISAAVANYVTREIPNMSMDKVRIVHYGIDPGPYARAEGERARVRSELNVSAGEWLVGTVARLVRQKALDVLLRAFADWQDRPDSPGAKLAIVGRGPLAEDLGQLARDLGIAERVVFLGFRTDIPALLAGFDVFALSSRYEGLGLVLLEAMCAGLPVVATRVSAIPEVVADGETGVLVSADDPYAFADALSHLHRHTDPSALGQSGHRRALSSFNPSQMAARTDTVYSEARDQRR